MLTEKQINRLAAAAGKAAEHSYSPYSGFRVGAALLLPDETIMTGTNVENRSYGLTICAERAVLAAAVSAGYRRFKALFLACPDAQRPVTPCGACRQVLSEFVNEDFPVLYTYGRNNPYMTCTMGELLPMDSLFELKTD